MHTHQLHENESHSSTSTPTTAPVSWSDSSRQPWKTRPVIDQAKGILMRDRGCTAEEAFDLLVAASQRTNRKLRQIAEDVVASVTQAS